MAIVGPSGIGKSTLLRLISGLDTNYEGTISPPDNVSMVFQEPTLFPWISCLQNLTEACEISEEQALDWLRRVDLSKCADLFPDQMSLGQQRRLALARAFGISPKLLLLDEAFVSLDPAIYRDMIQLFKSLKSETQVATLMITHDIAEAHELADMFTGCLVRLHNCLKHRGVFPIVGVRGNLVRVVIGVLQTFCYF